MAAVAGGRITAGVGANLIGQHAADRNQDATVYVGGLDPQVLPTAYSDTAMAPRPCVGASSVHCVSSNQRIAVSDVRGTCVGAVCASWTCR